jgi:hypothetical protein
MNNSFDPRMMSESRRLRALARRYGRTWIPGSAETRRALNTGLWLTRASRGLAWNRSGRAVSRVAPHD